MLKLARAMPAELGQHALVGGVKRNKETNVNQSGDTRLGLGQLLRARIRPMAGDSPSGYTLTGQSGPVFDVARPPWREGEAIIFDDSLNMFWRVPPDSAASLDLRHNASVKGSVRSGLCTHAMRVSVPAHGAVRLHSDQPIKRSAQLSLQFWARGASSQWNATHAALTPS